MNNIIKELRIKRKLTQLDLANILNISDKTISKWETGKGLPDISLLEPLASALNVSVLELMRGSYIENNNKISNMHNISFYVCPKCGNIINSIGSSVISCCGNILSKLEINEDDNSIINIEIVENEYYVTINHEMTKENYISFIAYVTIERLELVKLYPEQNADARFLKRGHGNIYIYSNKFGLIKKKI